MKTYTYLPFPKNPLHISRQMPCPGFPEAVAEFQLVEERDAFLAAHRACHGLDLPADVPPGILAELVQAAAAAEAVMHAEVMQRGDNDAEFYDPPMRPVVEWLSGLLAKLGPAAGSPDSAADAGEAVSPPEDGPFQWLRFRPQAWTGGGREAVDIDPPGDPTFFVPLAGFLEKFPTRADWYGGGDDRDDYRDHPNAPQWVKDWDGPFEVDTEDLGPWADED